MLATVSLGTGEPVSSEGDVLILGAELHVTKDVKVKNYKRSFSWRASFTLITNREAKVSVKCRN